MGAGERAIIQTAYSGDRKVKTCFKGITCVVIALQNELPEIIEQNTVADNQSVFGSRAKEIG